MLKKRIKLLIIDDEKDICAFEKSYFKRRNLTVHTAQTATKALTLAKKIKPEVVLIDIHMTKGISGLEILEKLRKVSPLCKCIIVSWDKDKISQAKELGAVDFLIKPIELPSLEKAVYKIIKKLEK